MIRTLVAIVVFSYTARLFAASSCSACPLVPDVILTLHAMDWRQATPAEVAAVLPFKVSPREAVYPSDSPYRAECTGSLYLIAEERGVWSLSIEFERELVKDRCVDVLTSVGFEATTSHAMANEIQGRAASAVKATGAQVSPQATEYKWRSADSRTRFDLFTSVVAKTKPRPNTLARLKVILSHDAVIPSDVDDLPFEKGFMCSSAREVSQ